MSDTKVKRTRIVTPVGIARYPRLSQPDTKYKPEGEYKCDIILTAEEASPIIEQIDRESDAGYEAANAEHAANLKKARKPVTPLARRAPYQDELDAEGNPTGNVILKTKALAQFKDKKTQEIIKTRPALFNAKGVALDPSKVKLGGGSKIRVQIELSTSFTALAGYGVSLRLKAVKIIELVEFGSGKDASQFGLGGEEDGYDGEGTDSSGFGEESESSEDAPADEAPKATGSGKKTGDF